MSDVRDRRVLHAEEISSAGTFLVPRQAARSVLMKWIETNTGSRFYIGNGFVTFEDEGDVLMFKLGPHYDRERVKKAEEALPKFASTPAARYSNAVKYGNR